MATPTHLSATPADIDLSAAEAGEKLLGFDLFEQGWNVARVILARDEDGLPAYPQVDVLIPRRGTKTTSVWTVLVGLAATVPESRIVTSAQTGSMASRRMREMMTILESRAPDVKTYWSIGSERIMFPNGSTIWCVKPKSAAFRSEAADIIFLDEAGEIDQEDSEDLLGGALPLLDTRPMGQVIIAGTPAKMRAGLFWDTLQEARAGDLGCGIVDYSVRDDEEIVTVDDDGNPQVVADVLRRVHPGIGTLTTFNKIAGRLKKMGRPMFEREYGCRFPRDSMTSAISWETWESLQLDGDPDYPERIGLGFDVAPDDSSAALCAAWRDTDGVAHVYLLAYEEGGSAALHAVATRASRKFGRAIIGHDTIGANQAVAERLGKQRPAPRTDPQTMKQMMGSAQTITQDIRAGDLRHYGQPELDRAVKGATWRDVQNSGRLFARKNSRSDVCPLVAAQVALAAFDALPPSSGAGMSFG